jgi:hypothetical protein
MMVTIGDVLIVIIFNWLVQKSRLFRLLEVSLWERHAAAGGGLLCFLSADFSVSFPKI